jgi:hypothetical protein
MYRDGTELDTMLGEAEHFLALAGDALFSAADLLSDQAAEYAAERDLGVPHHGPRSLVARLYALSKKVEADAELVSLLRDEADHD